MGSTCAAEAGTRSRRPRGCTSWTRTCLPSRSRQPSPSARGVEMGRRFIPIVIVLAVAAFAVAAAALAFVADEPRLWSAAIALIVLGGITPMIYAVNVRIVPVFSRRQWTDPHAVYTAISAGVA